MLLLQWNIHIKGVNGEGRQNTEKSFRKISSTNEHNYFNVSKKISSLTRTFGRSYLFHFILFFYDQD
uniref:Uncharacterized protein n=1 Tax=Octopus bimaculoides TaxID=37653 RepID=A0A0L8HVI8_OCTBM